MAVWWDANIRPNHRVWARASANRPRVNVADRAHPEQQHERYSKTRPGDITLAVMGLLDSWRLETQEIQAVLCLPETMGAGAQQAARGTDVLPDNPEVLRRAGYLLRISDALRTTYPLNPRMAGRWVRQGHRQFGRRSPLSIILRDGESA